MEYVALLANQTNDFTPIPQGAFVGLIPEGGYVTREPIGKLLCEVLDSCGNVETSITVSGALTYSRDNPVTYVGWVSSETCGMNARDGAAACSSSPTADEMQYIWTAPLAPTSADCDQWFGDNELNRMIDGMCGFDDRDFSERILFDLDLTGMRAPGASFVGMDLSSVTFDAANLAGADFTGANMSDSTFITANLTDAIMVDAIARRSDFTSAKLVRSALNGAHFTDSDFTEADLDDSVCIGADFRLTTLLDATFRSVKCGSALFIGSSVIATDFRNAILDGANFNDATIQGADFGGVNLGEVLGVE